MTNFNLKHTVFTDVPEIRKLNWDKLPPCGVYAKLVTYAAKKLNMEENTIRDIYGMLTIGEWVALLSD